MDVPTLTDGVVTLDALKADDADAMVTTADAAVAIVSDDEATDSVSDREEPLSLDAARSVVEEAASGWQRGTHYWFAIRPPMSRDTYGGRLDLWPADSGDRGHVGVFVVSHLRRQGLAQRAVKLALPFAYEVLGWTSVVAGMRGEDEAALRLAEKLGFERLTDSDPTYDGVEVYAHTREIDNAEAIAPTVTPETNGDSVPAPQR